jgi:hypothetical protein
MWDVRQTPMEWQIKASSSTINVHAFFADSGNISVLTSGGTLLKTISGSGDKSTGLINVTVGEIYRVRVNSGFHIRPHFDGVEWVRMGPGLQAAGPGGSKGFQSDAELGFDARWDHLPAVFADTTWSYNVAAGETLRISVEHMTGDTRGARRFEFISPTGVVTVADANGMPGSGTAHFQARGGSLANAPNPASIYWEEYTAPVSQAGSWGFRLLAHEGNGTPYSWHYVLDRTDAGADQFSYLMPGAILDPGAPAPSPVPEPSALTMLAIGVFGAGGLVWRRRRNRA